MSRDYIKEADALRALFKKAQKERRKKVQYALENSQEVELINHIHRIEDYAREKQDYHGAVMMIQGLVNGTNPPDADRRQLIADQVLCDIAADLQDRANQLIISWNQNKTVKEDDVEGLSDIIHLFGELARKQPHAAKDWGFDTLLTRMFSLVEQNPFPDSNIILEDLQRARLETQ